MADTFDFAFGKLTTPNGELPTTRDVIGEGLRIGVVVVDEAHVRRRAWCRNAQHCKSDEALCQSCKSPCHADRSTGRGQAALHGMHALKVDDQRPIF